MLYPVLVYSANTLYLAASVSYPPMTRKESSNWMYPGPIKGLGRKGPAGRGAKAYMFLGTVLVAIAAAVATTVAAVVVDSCRGC